MTAIHKPLTYEKAEETKDGDVNKLPLDGKSVIIEKKGDKYTFTYADDGKAVQDEERGGQHGVGRQASRLGVEDPDPLQEGNQLEVLEVHERRERPDDDERQHEDQQETDFNRDDERIGNQEM